MQQMKIEIISDLHGTLVNSNQAWIRAFDKVNPGYLEHYTQQIFHKRNRKDLASELNFDFEEIEAIYHSFVTPREDVIYAVNLLASNKPIIIVSNAPYNRVTRDLQVLAHKIDIAEIFTSDTIPNLKTVSGLHKILDTRNVLSGYYVGNDIEEDLIRSKRITPLLFPDKDKEYYIGEFK